MPAFIEMKLSTHQPDKSANTVVVIAGEKLSYVAFIGKNGGSVAATSPDGQ